VKPHILLVDDHPAVRHGLALLLEAEGIGSCREAGGRQEALDVAEREPPDLVIVDLSMGNEDTQALLMELRARRIPALVYSLHEDSPHVEGAMAAGARGYVTKSETRELARAVSGVLNGWILISPRAAEALQDD
jgi:DNA-binding NarL/FixJ family response regulator